LLLRRIGLLFREKDKPMSTIPKNENNCKTGVLDGLKSGCGRFFSAARALARSCPQR
jgi:hypothetical protein